MYDESIRMIEEAYTGHTDNTRSKTDFWKHNKRVRFSAIAASIVRLSRKAGKGLRMKRFSGSGIRSSSVLKPAKHGK